MPATLERLWFELSDKKEVPDPFELEIRREKKRPQDRRWEHGALGTSITFNGPVSILP
jgi:hypothetical protein